MSLIFFFFPWCCTFNFSFNAVFRYGTCSTGSLIFKLQVPDALAHGADLQWLSAFPSEAEVLYPPLTFLRPTGREQELVSNVSGARVSVMEVTPDLSA